MKLRSIIPALPAVSAALGLTVLGFSSAFAADGAAKEMAPVPVKLPAPTLKGTPDDLPAGDNIEPVGAKAPALPMVPKGVVNVALGKPVTCSTNPFSGTVSMVTDGKKEAFDDQCVEFRKGTQWVQVDLGKSETIAAIAIWHDHRYVQAFHDVIIQVSNDPEFKTGVTTLYNNDTDNSSGQGVGKDREYFEKEWGRVIPANGVNGRYVRSTTRGSNSSALNARQELEVYALPAP